MKDLASLIGSDQAYLCKGLPVHIDVGKVFDMIQKLGKRGRRFFRIGRNDSFAAQNLSLTGRPNAIPRISNVRKSDSPSIALRMKSLFDSSPNQIMWRPGTPFRIASWD
eukprot:scaffold2227_cov168-Amphora_coffeaeformis.AAC.11